MWYSYQPYVSMAQRAAKARAEVEKLRDKGGKPEPLVIEGKKLAREFWGKAWNEHIRQYCDLQNRLGKGRSYILNNLVIDFNLAPGKVKASVMGSSVYFVEIKIDTLQASLWGSIKSRCAGHIGSLVDLLSGKLSDNVMSVITEPDMGLFPVGKQMTFKCSCPDAAGGRWMCKHIAATLYGVGTRIDSKPEELFVLRGVDHLELISAATALPTLPLGSSSSTTIAEDALADVFGIELEGAMPAEMEGPAVVVGPEVVGPAVAASPTRVKLAPTVDMPDVEVVGVRQGKRAKATAVKKRAAVERANTAGARKGGSNGSADVTQPRATKKVAKRGK